MISKASSSPILWYMLLGIYLSAFTPLLSEAQSLTFVSVTNGPNNAGGTNNPGVFVVGAGPSRVTYTLTAGAVAIPAGATLTMDLPDGGAYVAGSVTGATQGSIADLNRPVFILPAVAPGGSVTISYQSTFGCAVIPYINGGGLTRDIGTLSSPAATLTPAATYNVVSASLSITTVTNASPTVNVGDSYQQMVTIRNGGINSIVPAPVTLNLGTAAGSTISAPSIGTLSGNTITFSAADITGANLLNDDGDNQWENGEDLKVTYTVTVNSCNNLGRSLTASWGDGNGTCQTSAPSTTGVNISNAVPNLTASISASPLSSCQIDVPRNLTVTVTNNGTGPAQNIRIEMLNHAFSTFNPSTPSIIVIASIVVNLPGGGTYIPGIAGTVVLGSIDNSSVNVLSNGCAIGQPGHVSVALPAGTILAPGQSLTVTYRLRYCDNNTCTGGINAADHGVILRYQNQCLNTTFSSNILGAVNGPRITLSNFNPEAPAVVQNGQCIPVDMDATFLSNFPAVTTDYVEFSVALPAGFTYTAGSLVSPAGSTLAPGQQAV